MVDVRTRIDEILGKGRLLSLGTSDEGGVWVADLLYVHDANFNVYWVSRKKRRHSAALRANTHVAVSITLSNPPEKDLGLQIAGVADELPSAPEIAQAYWDKRAEPPKRPMSEEHAWYRLRPSKIELIDEENFGHEKQTLEL